MAEFHYEWRGNLLCTAERNGTFSNCDHCCINLQEVRLAEVKKEMALEKYCEDTVKGNINEALDEFIDDLCYTWKEGVQETGYSEGAGVE